MSTSTLQLLPTSANEIAKLDPATLASIPGVAYDLKRLKVYSSCLRCRAKKVKCDRKEPCSRCEKHKVECSYRELASVQLDIRQFQRHLTNPKIRKDGAGIITSTATPIITLPSGDTAVLSPSTTAAASLIAAAKATALSTNSNTSSSDSNSSSSRKKSTKSSSTSAPPSPVEDRSSALASNSSTDTESDTPTRTPSSKSIAMARAKVNKIQRRKATTTISTPKRVKQVIQVHTEEDDENDDDDDDDDDDEEVERVVLRDDGDSTMREYQFHVQSDVSMSSAGESDNDDDEKSVPIWQAQAVGKHKQTAHEQEMAEAFGLAAYLKAKEMESSKTGQTIDYDMELERALAQRMPTSFSRPDRSLSRARKYAQAGYKPVLPYSRPSYCQLSSLPSDPNSPPLVAAHCCCQIAAMQGAARGTCYFSGNSNRSSAEYEYSSVSPPPQGIEYEQGGSTRIAYSPSCQPSYVPKDEAQAVAAAAALTKARRSTPTSSSNDAYSSMMPPPPQPLRKLEITTSSASTSPMASPRIELPPIYLPKLPSHLTTPASSDLSRFQVGGGRDGNNAKPPLEIACKYNEPNVDAWDMIERPISRPASMTTKRSRSAKMEVGWILS
ncbi:hypothetical protein BGZ80_004033 [Entomortierella chlamydospora]|uniref:Zn(2)-C6 fungal-type domain-containing protein n=1 Tax=Entomortierella chlamydospora TaxID=101097 RepID=A0A9P6MMQ2_9FUNG|nr:hypothetical protein BGZ79_003113 [Entomortierella chlamydospora]KAG0007962.1 hypothetical protein BGZ80_004033 [Entomortierella chlamydospora]